MSLSWRAVLAASLAAGSVGCFGSEPPPVAPSAPNREPVAKVARPQVLGTMSFDYTTLPVIEVGEETEPARVRPTLLRSALVDGSAPLALELAVGDTTMFAWPTQGPSVPRGAWTGCTPDASRSSSVAVARGFLLSTRTPDRAEVLTAMGVLDHAACRFEAGREARVVAPAIVPGVLYAVRECTSGCRLTPGNEKRKEAITLFGPPAIWITSNHPDAAELTRQRVGPFSRLSVPVLRGSSTSAAFTVEPAALLAFQRQTAAPTTRELTQYAIEIMWGEADPAPLATAYVATVSPGDVHDDEQVSRTFTP